MERVQYQQEQMLAELKDLEEKGLFSQTEIKYIMKKRTGFESALVRRIPKKGDFLRYAEYEMGLEALRRRRLERMNLPVAVPSISDFALVRRQFHIFERALRKFKGDVGLWVQYIELAKREGARALVGRVSARALQLHPNEAALYVFAAQNEVENLSPAAARALLQRGIRLNKESVVLWTEYVKFELGFVEGLRRRWDVLGVEEGDGLEDTGEEARREIMEGGIVKAVISEAGKANPRLVLFRSLDTLLRTYPTPLRTAVREHLHALLVETLPTDAAALKMYATRSLPAEAEDSDEFVDILRAANEALLERARALGGEVSREYAEFVEEWCGRGIDENLRLYLIASLQSLTSQGNVAAGVLAAHVRLLGGDAAKAVVRARKYTARAGRSAEVWLARLEAEQRAGVADSELQRTWAEARAQTEGDGRERVWMWGVRDGPDGQEMCEGLLRESMGSGMHESLLVHYVTRILHPADSAPDTSTRLRDMRRVVGRYLVTDGFFRAVFAHEAGLADAESVLEALYEDWRRRDGEGVAAGIAWAEWLLRDGQGGRAGQVIACTAGAEREWAGVLGGSVCS